VGARDERLAGNEALFREVNERVAEVATEFIEVETNTEGSISPANAGGPSVLNPLR